MTIYIPYTYLIGWSKQNVWYYGRRTAKNCNPDEFWISYFTSSKYVKEFRKEQGEPDIVKIRKTFPNNPDACKLWESKVLEKLDAQHNPKFLNKKNGDHKWDVTGKCWTEELYKKIENSIYKKYKVSNPFQAEECKEKRKRTWLEKYDSYHPIVSKICKENNLAKYGTEFTLQSEEIKNKGKCKKKELYGDENYNNREKSKHTNILKYGVDNPGKRIIKCKFCGEHKNINHQAKCKFNVDRIIPTLVKKKDKSV